MTRRTFHLAAALICVLPTIAAATQTTQRTVPLFTRSGDVCIGTCQIPWTDAGGALRVTLATCENCWGSGGTSAGDYALTDFDSGTIYVTLRGGDPGELTPATDDEYVTFTGVGDVGHLYVSPGWFADASQQTTERPGVDCSLLTPQQAQGLPCATPPKGTAAPAPMPPPPAPAPSGGFVPSAATCEPRPNPYAFPGQAAACSAWDLEQRPRPALPTYEVGAAYVHPYQSIRMVVIGIGSTMEGVPVVTGQFTGGTDLIGQVFAFRIDQPQPWTKQP